MFSFFVFQSVVTWTADLTGRASPATARATTAGTATSATSRPATTGALLTDPAQTEPAFAQTVRNKYNFKTMKIYDFFITKLIYSGTK
jgi:hypothetical protein